MMKRRSFFKEVLSMYDNPSKAQAAGEVALGIIEARRVRDLRTPRQEPDKFRRWAESGRWGLRDFGAVGNRAADSIYGKKSPGDRMPQNMLEGQRFAEVFPDALSDDDFMRVSIAQIVEKNLKPKKDITEEVYDEVIDYGSKLIRDWDLGGMDDVRSPQGVRSKQTPPRGYGYPISEPSEVPDSALRPEDARKRKKRSR